MAISETKMQMVIANYFKDECDVNTSIRQAFEKGFRIGVKKGASTDRPQGEWIEVDDYFIRCKCSICGWESHKYEDDVYGMPYCPNCGAKMKGADDENKMSCSHRF